MARWYSVIQYVPDPIAEEKINIGVIVFDDEHQLQARFLNNWSRVESFGMEDISFLKDFARRMQYGALGGISLPEESEVEGKHRTQTIDLISRISRGWINSIQFTEPRGSLDSFSSLLEHTVKSYLREPKAEN